MSSFATNLNALSLTVGIIAVIISLFIAIRSLKVSQESLKLSTESLREAQQSNEIANRPYVGCINFTTIDEHHKPIDKVHLLAFYCLNRPARVTRQHIKIFSSDERRKPEFDDDSRVTYITYPFGSDTYSRTYFVDRNIVKLGASLKPAERLYRSVEIDYETLDGDRQFHLKTTWVYDPHEQIWREEKTDAD